MDETEMKIIRLIEEHKEEIITFAEDIEAHPEPGFQEVRTSGKTAEFLKKLGYQVQNEIALTGVRGDWRSKEEGPNISIIGEMDAIGCKSHEKANPFTGVAHACGHHAQMAAMIGTAVAFSDSEITKGLSGSLTFFGVPAEEYIDADKRAVLRQQGIRFGSGKS